MSLTLYYILFSVLFVIFFILPIVYYFYKRHVAILVSSKNMLYGSLAAELAKKISDEKKYSVHSLAIGPDIMVGKTLIEFNEDEIINFLKIRNEKINSSTRLLFTYYLLVNLERDYKSVSIIKRKNKYVYWSRVSLPEELNPAYITNVLKPCFKYSKNVEYVVSGFDDLYIKPYLNKTENTK